MRFIMKPQLVIKIPASVTNKLIFNRFCEGLIFTPIKIIFVINVIECGTIQARLKSWFLYVVSEGNLALINKLIKFGEIRLCCPAIYFHSERDWKLHS